MPINAGYEYFNAEKKFEEARTIPEKITALEEVIRAAPKHKSSENLLKNLRIRLKKLQTMEEKSKKSGGGRKGIKKEGFQIVLVGLPNGGKSSLIAKITNAKPKVDAYSFTTNQPEIGTFYHQGVKAQIVDLPSIGSEFLDIGIIHTANGLIIVVENLDQLPEIEKHLFRATQNRIIVVNKSDNLNENELRKLNEKIRSKKLNAIPISCITNLGIDELKNRIIKSMNVIRVYTKEPGKPHSPTPVVLPINSTVKDVSESIRKGFYRMVFETRVTGPSSKFPNQKTGLSHVLKDLDIVEFHTR
ncbi:MAG: GTPase [archaeon]